MKQNLDKSNLIQLFYNSAWSWMHTSCVLCIFWAHASNFVTSRPFLMRLVWSAFE